MLESGENGYNLVTAVQIQFDVFDAVAIQLFCASWTLSFKGVLEFSTNQEEKLNVETEASYA